MLGMVFEYQNMYQYYLAISFNISRNILCFDCFILVEFPVWGHVCQTD